MKPHLNFRPKVRVQFKRIDSGHVPRRKALRIALITLLFSLSAFAQGPSSQIAPACGSKDVNFEMKLDDSQHTLAQPEPGTARVYFIQDDGSIGNQHYTLRIGLDGKWVGTYKESSYFTVSVQPGERHLCVNVQSNYSRVNLVELAHFTAESGRVYYFRTRFHTEMVMARLIATYLDLSPTEVLHLP